MKSPSSKVRVKKVKAFAVLRGGEINPIIDDWSPFPVFEIEDAAQSHMENIFMHMSNGYRIVPCTITYTLPPKKK